jgi:ATP-binding protein involved in chromosome partitioning
MAEVTEAAVLAALKAVADPDRGGNIVDLGMISGLALRAGHVAFAIEVDRARAARLEGLRHQAERAVSALPGVLSVSAVLTAERPAGAGKPAAAQAQARHQNAPGQEPQRQGPQGQGPQGQPPRGAKPDIPGVHAIVAVASGKGGVGKSTTAVNLALALRSLSLRVGLLDADIYGPSQPRMMGISGRPSSPDGRRLLPMSNYGVKVMSMGFMVPEDTPMIWRGPMVMSAINQMLRDVDWGDLDILVVDLPPGTGDAQLTMAQQVPLSGAVIVSTPQDIALIDARKGLNMFRKVDVPVLGIIENMSYFLCPHCGERSEVFSHGGARREAEKLGVDFLGELPLDMAIRETSDGGHPIVVARPESDPARTYRAIAEQVWGKVAGAPAKAAPRIVIQ